MVTVKEQLIEYCLYNEWACERMKDVLMKAGEEAWEKEIVSSFSSLKKTWFHIWDAQIIWITRLNGGTIASWPSKDFTGSMTEALEKNLDTCRQLTAWVKSSSDSFLMTNLNYRLMDGSEGSTPYYQVIHHVMNHGTFHRGQLITMFRQLNLSNIPTTDFIFYARLKKQQLQS